MRLTSLIGVCFEIQNCLFISEIQYKSVLLIRFIQTNDILKIFVDVMILIKKDLEVKHNQFKSTTMSPTKVF